MTNQLSRDECWRLLESQSVGRLAVTSRDGADIFPVNFLVSDGALYFRSAPGKKLIDITRNPDVAFEVDGILTRQRWSVVVHGRANRLGSDPEIEASGVNLLESHSPTTKWNYVRIQPKTVTGRRLGAQ